MSARARAMAAARGAVGAKFRLHGRDPAFGLDCEILDREREELADGRRVHPGKLQPREENARGGQHRFHFADARDLVKRRLPFAQQALARIEEHPSEARRRVGSFGRR